MKEKSSVIEFYRYIFMVVLLAWHGGTNFFTNGYLVVEFFFILSGYLLMESFLRRTKTAVQYTMDKLKRTYLQYFIALCFGFLAFGLLASWVHHNWSMSLIFEFIREILLIQSVGLYIDGGFNPPTWYFSVLIWGGALLYYMISRYTELSTHLLIPVMCLATLTFLCNQGDSLEVWNIRGCFYVPFIRGVAEMGVGVLLCTFAHSRYSKVRNSKLMDCLSALAVLFLFYLFCTEKNYDKYVFLFVPLIVFVGLNNKSFLNAIFSHKIWYKLGGGNLRNVFDSFCIRGCFS